LVATGFAPFVATTADLLVATADDDEAGATAAIPELAPAIGAPAMLIALVAPNCGGVIANTAPRPPTVPPAINSARFISYPRFWHFHAHV
jgi:hypothetical protein